MSSFKSKKHKVKFLNPKGLLRYCHIALLPFYLTSCMGVYEGGFECPPGEGVKCKSISEVNEMVDQGLGVKNQVTEKKSLEEGIEHSCSVKDSSDSCSHELPEIWYAPWIHKEQVSRGYPIGGSF